MALAVVGLDPRQSSADTFISFAAPGSVTAAGKQPPGTILSGLKACSPLGASSSRLAQTPLALASLGGGRSYNTPYTQFTYLQGEIVQRLTGEGATNPIVFGEIGRGRRYHLYVSRHNEGARAVAEEVKERFPAFQWTERLKELTKCDHMLVLLHSDTWANADFAHELCEAMRKGVHRQLAVRRVRFEPTWPQP